MCIEYGAGYENYLRKKAERGEAIVQHGKSPEELQAMIDRVRERNASKSS